MTIRKSMLPVAMLVFAMHGPLFAADPQLAVQQPAAEAETQVETLSGDSIPAAVYNKGLATKSRDHYCGARACDTAPALLSARAPIYPAAALAAETEGRAAILFDIDAQGIPRNIAVQSATAAEFGEAALEAVRSWRFRPATLGGKPVEYQQVLQLFPFELRD